MNRLYATEELSRLTRDLVFSLLGRELTPFLAAWPLDLFAEAEPAHGGGARATAALPVLRWLPHLDGRGGFAAKLIACLAQAAPALAWRQTYEAADVEADFLTNYGYTELVGPTGPLPSTSIACGFLLLGPTTVYPRHRHEAEEIYVPLYGHAQWLQGDGVWREHAPGSVIHHVSEEPHAMQTGSQPLLALYLWRSANLQQKSRLLARRVTPTSPRSDR